MRISYDYSLWCCGVSLNYCTVKSFHLTYLSAHMEKNHWKVFLSAYPDPYITYSHICLCFCKNSIKCFLQKHKKIPNEAFKVKINPLFNFIENICLQCNHWKSAEQNDKSLWSQEKIVIGTHTTSRKEVAPIAQQCFLSFFTQKASKSRDWNYHWLPVKYCKKKKYVVPCRYVDLTCDFSIKQACVLA